MKEKNKEAIFIRIRMRWYDVIDSNSRIWTPSNDGAGARPNG